MIFLVVIRDFVGSMMGVSGLSGEEFVASVAVESSVGSLLGQ